MPILFWIKKFVKPSMKHYQDTERNMYSKFEEVNEKQQPIEIAKRLDWLQQNLSHCSDIAYHTF
ncbi:hypothetical protein, partial [Paenibacillus alginolyticus]|uniref:hypothetical protein n=1 Tax=Paenibacillus alginolyticus TaxID=59839 RepID=UPI001C25F7A6